MSDFTPNPQAVTASRGWMLDVDGCLMRTTRAGGAGGEPMPRAVELLEALYAAGHAVVVCTNASERTPAAYAEHLRAAGLPVRDEDFTTAGSAAAEYIAHHHPGARVLVLGAEGLSVPLQDLGVEVIGPSEPAGTAAETGPGKAPADVVVVGAARGYTTELINAACLAVDGGAPLYATVASPWFHGGHGRSVAVSAVMARAITWATGVEPHILGKPSPALGETLQRHLGVPAERITIVGDATAEIDLARTMGANAALVLSGATDAAHLAALEGDRRPDVALADVAELLEQLTPALNTTHPSEGARP